MKPVDFDTVSETEIPHGGIPTSRQNTNHGVVVLPNLQSDFSAVFPKQCGPQNDCREANRPKTMTICNDLGLRRAMRSNRLFLRLASNWPSRIGTTDSKEHTRGALARLCLTREISVDVEVKT